MKILKLLPVLILLPCISMASESAKTPIQMKWSFDGFFGRFDKQSIQRGFQVYKEVCAACHGLSRVAYRNLTEIGFSEAEVKAIASTYDVIDGPGEDGEMFERPGRPSDYFVSPYKNDNAAKAANNGSLPPDLSLIIKARHDGANYLYSLLTGYNEEVPADVTIDQGQYYNPYMDGGKIAMPNPLSDGLVEYIDGTEATVSQMSKDIVHFLQWAAEPEMEKRKFMGIRTLIFLGIFTILFYVAKKRVWADVK